MIAKPLLDDGILGVGFTKEGMEVHGPVPRPRAHGIEGMDYYRGEMIAICGSREYPDLDEVRTYVRSLPEDTVIVSGGAQGPDHVAEQIADERALSKLIHPAKWHRWVGQHPAWVRNNFIAEDCDRMVAFWDGVSRGTSQMIDLALKRGKPVEVRHCGIVVQLEPKTLRP